MPHTFARNTVSFRFFILLLIATLIAWPFIEPYLLQTEHTTLSSPVLTKGALPLRIVYLADIHAGPFFNRDRVEALISRINSLKPDLILLGGDYGDTSSDAIAFFEELPALHARYAVCGVVGNHDRTAPESNLRVLESAMAASGVTPLINRVHHIDTHAGRIAIAGIDDIDNGWPQFPQVVGDIASDEYVIFLCHSPGILSDYPAEFPWYDLALFGHTHGGQVAPLSPLLAPSNVPEQYYSGWTTLHGIPHLTSRGVGTTFLPVRLLCLPQLHVIDLVPQ